MDQKQYDAKELLAEKCRKFLDEVYRFMEQNGLLSDQHDVTLSIRNYETLETLECKYLKDVIIEKSYNVFGMDFQKEKMEYWDKDGKGWVIMSDPHGKSGIISKHEFEIDYSEIESELREMESRECPEGKTEEPTTPSGNDSLWFHDDDGDPPMVCRGDLNDSVVESGSSS